MRTKLTAAIVLSEVRTCSNATAMPDERRIAISSLSRETMNPYLSQLYAALDEQGIPRGPDAALTTRWLLDNRATRALAARALAGVALPLASRSGTPAPAALVG